MIIRSLRWRLLAGAGIAIFLALLVSWMLMMLLFQRHLERRLATELQSEATQIVAGLTVDSQGRPSVADPPSDPRFQTPASGLYWQVSTRGLLVRSPSLWDQALPQVAAPSNEWESRVGHGPFQGRLAFLERQIRPAAHGAAVLVQVAQDASVLRAAGREFGRELAIFLTLLWLVLSAAAWAQVSLGLRPLTRLRRDVGDLQKSPSARLRAAGVSEVRPLIGAINALADARERDLETARRRATDLAHRLKTPLAAAAAEARRARKEGAAESAAGLDGAIEAMRVAIEAELARTRISAVRAGGGASCKAAEVVDRLVAVLERTEAGEQLSFEVAIADKLTVPVAADDLTEMIGALAENAVRYAHRSVRFGGDSAGGHVRLCVEDDGPGIAEAWQQQALLRGTRLDEVGIGQGLGLAIVNDLAEATGGMIELGTSPLGGLRVTASWPRPGSASAR
jgi:signal transduction histidine kinase